MTNGARAVRPAVSVAVLSFNRPRQLGAAIASIRSQSLAPAEILVVDNPSESSDAIRRQLQDCPEVRLITPPENLGFAGGMNLALSQVTSGLVLLTEDDLVLDPDCLERLVACQHQRPDAALVAPIIYNLEAGTVRCAGGMVSLGGVYRHTLADCGAQAPSGDRTRPRDVQFLPGAILLARTAVLRDTGGFRADFFMYNEDTELCLRLRRLGHAIVLEPRAACRHFEPADGRASPALEYHKLKNLVALYLLQADWRVWPEFVLRYCVLALLTGRVRRAALIRAWAWAAWNAPRLIRDRRLAGRRLVAATPAAPVEES